MRRLCVALCIVTIITLGAIGCERLPHVAQSAPVGGPKLTYQDTLMVVGSKMSNVYLGWESPSVPGLAKDAKAQEKLDEKADRTKPRMAWALHNPETRDLLEIRVATGSAGGSEGALRDTAAARRKSALEHGRVIQEDTIEWHGTVHEYRQRSHDPRTNTDWVIRCVASAESRPTPTTVCYTADGPTAAATLGRTVQGLALLKYLGPRNGPTQQGAARNGPTQQGATRNAPAPDGLDALDAPPPQKPSPLTFGDGKAWSSVAGFVLPVPPRFINDTALESAIKQFAMGHALGWALVDKTTGDHITIDAFVVGQYEIDEASWRQQAENSLDRALHPNHGKVLSQKIEWRADTAMYRWAVLDSLGRYKKTLCKGSSIARNRPAVVCVHTTSRRADLYDDVLIGLLLITPDAP